MMKLNISIPKEACMALMIAGGIIILTLPFLLNSYILRVITVIGLYTILAQSLNLISGYAGQVSIGHAGFYAIGAYTSALMALNFGLPFWLCMIIAMCVTALFGALLGLPTMRVSGTYLAVVTIGFCEVVRMVFLNFEGLAGGPLGLSKIPRPSLFGIEFTSQNGGYYYLVIILLAFTVFVIHRLIHSDFGRVLVAIKGDELASEMMGIRTTQYKIVAFVISAAFAGLAGSFYAHFMTYIDPNAFVFDESVLMLSIVILGGMGSIPGMFVGTILLVTLPELLRSLQEYRFVMYGVVLVLTMRYRPHGLLGGESKQPFKLPKGIIRKGESDHA